MPMSRDPLDNENITETEERLKSSEHSMYLRVCVCV